MDTPLVTHSTPSTPAADPHPTDPGIQPPTSHSPSPPSPPQAAAGGAAAATPGARGSVGGPAPAGPPPAPPRGGAAPGLRPHPRPPGHPRRTLPRLSAPLPRPALLRVSGGTPPRDPRVQAPQTPRHPGVCPPPPPQFTLGSRCLGPPQSPHSHPGGTQASGGDTHPHRAPQARPGSQASRRGPRHLGSPPPRCAFFPGAIDRPPGGLLGRGGLRPVSVAVGLEGVTIIDPREKVRGTGVCGAGSGP